MNSLKTKTPNGLSLIFALMILLASCMEKKEGIWDDNIKLSAKSVEFNALGDSVIIKTKGSSWWITSISVNGTFYSDFNGVDVLGEKYSIKQDCFVVERRDKNTLFVKVDENTLPVKRIVNIELEDGDYFDNVTITQKPK